MSLVFLTLAVLVVLGVALVVVGRFDGLGDAPADRSPGTLPPHGAVEPEDVDAVRFAVAVRGYRMDEVDEVLDRLAAGLAEQRARVAELEDELAGRSAGAGAPASGPWQPPTPAPDPWATAPGPVGTAPGPGEAGHELGQVPGDAGPRTGPDPAADDPWTKRP